MFIVQRNIQITNLLSPDILNQIQSTPRSHRIIDGAVFLRSPK